MTEAVTFDARVIGAGRAGGAMAAAMRTAGWRVDGPLGRDHDRTAVASGARVVFLAVPDAAVETVAGSLTPGPAVIGHLAGSLGLDVLAGHGHDRIASLHPLVSLPDAAIGARRLIGAWFGTAGDAITDEVVALLGGRGFPVADPDRAAYHATAAVAANHLVALLGQVERLASGIDVPAEAFLDLARGAFDNAVDVGAHAALTGPVARGDWGTVANHLRAIPAGERATYAILADAARRLLDPPPGPPTAPIGGAR